MARRRKLGEYPAIEAGTRASSVEFWTEPPFRIAEDVSVGRIRGTSWGGLATGVLSPREKEQDGERRTPFVGAPPTQRRLDRPLGDPRVRDRLVHPVRDPPDTPCGSSWPSSWPPSSARWYRSSSGGDGAGGSPSPSSSSVLTAARRRRHLPLRAAARDQLDRVRGGLAGEHRTAAAAPIVRQTLERFNVEGSSSSRYRRTCRTACSGYPGRSLEVFKTLGEAIIALISIAVMTVFLLLYGPQFAETALRLIPDGRLVGVSTSWAGGP